MVHLNRQPASARVLIQKAMLFANMHGGGDLLHAQSLLEQVMASTKTDAERLKPLANLLNSDYGEWRRLDDNADRLNQQLREEQHRTEQLSNKLDALKNIENAMQARPRAMEGTVAPPNNGN
jgi:chromosome segregation ATPase